MTEDEAIVEFRRLRWADNGGEPYCHKCGEKKIYRIKRRAMYRCSNPKCQQDFSDTSGTIFASGKKSCKDYLRAIDILVNGKRGKYGGILRTMATELGCELKTAHVLAGKIREALEVDESGFLREVFPALVVSRPPSKRWSGYWQRTSKTRHRVDSLEH